MKEDKLLAIIYRLIVVGQEEKFKLRNGLGVAFKPGQITISRVGVPPSYDELLIFKERIRKAVRARVFASLRTHVVIKQSGLLRWDSVDRYGYRLTWSIDEEE